MGREGGTFICVEKKSTFLQGVLNIMQTCPTKRLSETSKMARGALSGSSSLPAEVGVFTLWQ